MSRAAYCASTRLYLLTLCLRRRVEVDSEPLDDWLRPLISNAILALTTEHSAILATNRIQQHNSSSRTEPSQCRSATAISSQIPCQTLLAAAGRVERAR